MVTIYVRKLEKEDEEIYDKYPRVIQKIIWIYVRIFNNIQIRTIDKDRKEYLIPNATRKSFYKKVIRKLNKEGSNLKRVQIVLAKKLKKYEDKFKNYIIVNGKNIFFKYIEEILENILYMIGK